MSDKRSSEQPASRPAAGVDPSRRTSQGPNSGSLAGLTAFSAPPSRSGPPAQLSIPQRTSTSGQSLPPSSSTTPRVPGQGSASSTPTGTSAPGGPPPWAPGASGGGSGSRVQGATGSSTVSGVTAAGATANGSAGVKPQGLPVAGLKDAAQAGAGAAAARVRSGTTPPGGAVPGVVAGQAPRTSSSGVGQTAGHLQQQQQQQQHVLLGQAAGQGGAHVSATGPAARPSQSGGQAQQQLLQQQQQQQQAAQQAQAQGQAQAQSQHPAYNNPMYGAQDTYMSPLGRKESYNPSMSDNMAAVSRAQVQSQPPIHQQQLQQQPQQQAPPSTAPTPQEAPHLLPPQQLQFPHSRPGTAAAGGPTPAAQPQRPPAHFAPGPGPRPEEGGAPSGPAVAQPGDLFDPRAVSNAQNMHPTSHSYLCGAAEWEYQRPSLTGLDLLQAAARGEPAAPPPDFAMVTPQELRVSEKALLEELLDAFLGTAGRTVQPRLLRAGPSLAAAGSGTGLVLSYSVREDVHPTLRERAGPLLPICEYVVVLQRFVETRSAHCYGTVTHALAAALRGYLEDWYVLVAMVESQLLRGGLDLVRLAYYAQQPGAALRLLADVAAEAARANKSSAGLLTMLYNRYSKCAGSGSSRSLLQHLLTAAAAPYCAVLERWLRQGLLDDPYHEFMVQENQELRQDGPASGPAAPSFSVRASSYWAGRYTLRRVASVEDDLGAGPRGQGAAAGASSGPQAMELSTPPPRARGQQQQGGGSGGGASGGAVLDVPSFLLPYVELILRTGKYQNVLRECGQPVAQPTLPQSATAAAAGAPPAPLPPLAYSPAHPAALAQHVKAAHAAASSALLAFVLRGGGGAGAAGGGGRALGGPGGLGGGGGGGGAGLVAVLRSMKHFFLLDQGDVLLALMEVADEELRKPAKAINRTRLQSLMEMAVKISSAAADPHADSLGFEMDPRPLEALARAVLGAAAGADGAAGRHPGMDSPYTPAPAGARATSGPGAAAAAPASVSRLGQGDQNLPGWDLFLPTLKLGWPANLVVGGEELEAYQLLFKHLWGLKRCEQQLQATWVLLQDTKRMWRARGVRGGERGGGGGPAASRQRQVAIAHALCHQLLFTVQELLRYGTLDVLEPLWGALEEGVTRRAADVDQVIDMHREFLRRAVSGLLLDAPRPLGLMVGVAQCASGFARHMAALWDRLQEGIEMASKAVQVNARELEREAYVERSFGELQRLMVEATERLRQLVDAVREHQDGLRMATLEQGAGSGGGAGGAGGPGWGGVSGGGGGGDGVSGRLGWGGGEVEALQNLVERLDFTRPAAGSLGAVMAQL